jgi:hypothetical protein
MTNIEAVVFEVLFDKVDHDVVDGLLKLRWA